MPSGLPTIGEVAGFADRVTLSELHDTLVALSDDPSDNHLSILKEFLHHRSGDWNLKHALPHAACLALLRCGPGGVVAMLEALPTAPGSIHPTAIIAALWRSSRGRSKRHPLFGPFVPNDSPLLQEPLPEVTEASRSAMSALSAEIAVDPDLFLHVATFFQQVAFTELDDADARRDLMAFLSEGSITISPSVIRRFEELVDLETREEVYQRFFSEFPALIDPLASTVISKHSLGTEFVTDFVVKRHDGMYVVVEIEKPSDRIFTNSDDFTAAFSHAFGQVLDFQQWIGENISYAQSRLPGVLSPRGLLVIGRSSDLTERQGAKLFRFNANSNNIEVVTYDELIEGSKRLYENLHGTAAFGRTADS